MQLTRRRYTRRNLFLLGTGGVAASIFGSHVFGAAGADDLEGTGTVVNGKVAAINAAGFVLTVGSETRDIVFTPQTECLFGPSASVQDLEVGDHVGIQGADMADGRFEARRLSPIFQWGEATADAVQPDSVRLNGVKTRLLRRDQARLSRGRGRALLRGERVGFAVTRRGSDGRFEVGAFSELP